MTQKHRLSAAACLVILTIALFSQATFANPNNPIDDLQERIAEAGEYSFSADVEQTLIPRANPATIGRQSERVDVRITGQVELPNTATVSMLFEANGMADTPITLEQEGANTYLVTNGERQLIENPAGASAAPGGDYTAYLHAAENVRLKESEANSDFVVYEYDINGKKLADYLASLAQQSSPLTAYGVTTEPSSLLQSMNGTGEIWIDGNGLPRRQILDLQLPEMTADYNLSSHMEINFVFPAEPEPAANGAATANSNVGVPLVGAQRGAMPDQGTHEVIKGPPYDELIASSQLVTISWGLAMLVLGTMGVLLALRNRRWRQVVIPITLVLAIFFTPILQTVGINMHTAASAEAVSLTEALGLEPERGHPAGGLNLETSLPSFQADSSPTNACGNGDEAADTDLDGLNDFVENCLGTDSYYFDSDRDTITDTLEVAGFDYNGRTWYSNPLKEDSNGDGLSDLDEWEQPIGYAPSIDPDNDGIPNLWDDDND
ncbi:MAG: hypothetical protein AAF902_18405, partial [Chloroflexota bacterium]